MRKDCLIASNCKAIFAMGRMLLMQDIPVIPGCCSHPWVQEGEENFQGLLSRVEFFNMETNTWTKMANMKYVRGSMGLAIINNKITSFNTLVYKKIPTGPSGQLFYFEPELVPMFYEELDDELQWRNVSYPTQANPATFLTFQINHIQGFTKKCE